ncbi:Reticulon-like protein B10 [Cardamine amara subsp. amara]|uniref:Reticulon-like protein n=1 Tax=Cardamine amara subsp. amara TaxID=228776 RepID=A0ABD1BZJ7_CARAN
MEDSHHSSHTSLHQSIAAGASVSDLIMWKNRRGGFILLGSTTLLWFLFEKCGYSFFPFIVNIQLLLVVILFLWAKSAILFNRPMPQLPNFEISEASVFMVADALRVWINTLLSVAREIYVGRNAKQLFRVSIVLWTISFVGSFLNFLTILYLGVVLSLLIPLLYERYQDHIDDKLSLAHRIVQTQYRKIDERLLQKIVAKPTNKIKKMQ